MLRCPPSRIELTSSDIVAFERRLAAQHPAKLIEKSNTKLRLSRGAARLTSLSITPAEQNISRRRATSSSSEATLHNESSQPSRDDPSGPVACHRTNTRVSTTGTHAQTSSPDHAALCFEGTKALESTINPQPVHIESSPRRQVDSFYGTHGVSSVYEHLNHQHEATSGLDGVRDFQAAQTPNQVRCLESTDTEGFGEIDDAELPATRQRQTAPRLLSSARARRRYIGSQDAQTCPDQPGSEEHLRSPYTAPPAHRTNPARLEFTNPTPQLMLPVEVNLPSSNPALDPGAPVFVPRIRFGSAEGIPYDQRNHTHDDDAQQTSIDNIHNLSDLRIRSSSERNSNISSRHQCHRSPPAPTEQAIAIGDNGLRVAVRSRPQRRSRAADQNTAISSLRPNFEQFPLTHSATTSSWRLRNSNHHTPNEIPLRESQPQIPAVSHEQQVTTFTSDDYDQIHIQNVHAVHVWAERERSAYPTQALPAPSSNSQSTPNLLQRPPQLSTRESSLLSSRGASSSPSYHRLASMVSGASGISSSQHASRKSSGEGLNASIEFLHMRNSPLDDLTERLSRISASRPRSVGRSWERPPNGRSRISLLTGDPFRPKSSASRPPVINGALLDNAARTSEPEVDQELESAEELIALSLALPPSSPLPVSPKPALSTAFAPDSSPPTFRSPLAQHSSVQIMSSPESAIKRKPVPTVSMTPKVVVYDDSKPLETQPKTPTDLSRSKKRGKTRSDTTTQQSPIFVGQAMISSPPTIPERHPHRNTYPPANVIQSSGSTPVSTAATPEGRTTAGVSQTGQRMHHRRRVELQRSSEEAENEYEGHLHGLEEDRRVWLHRREDGSLEITPPKEGRFERYLL